VPVNEPVVASDQRRTAADQRQAEYYQHLLDGRREEINHRITKYQTVVAAYEARGSGDDARRVRRMIRPEERERQMLERMLEALRRRFALPVLRPVDASRQPPHAITHSGHWLRSIGHPHPQPQK
jgi:hypothetical protein